MFFNNAKILNRQRLTKKINHIADRVQMLFIKGCLFHGSDPPCPCDHNHLADHKQKRKTTNYLCHLPLFHNLRDSLLIKIELAPSVPLPAFQGYVQMRSFCLKGSQANDTACLLLRRLLTELSRTHHPYPIQLYVHCIEGFFIWQGKKNHLQTTPKCKLKCNTCIRSTAC